MSSGVDGCYDDGCYAVLLLDAAVVAVLATIFSWFCPFCSSKEDIMMHSPTCEDHRGKLLQLYSHIH